MGTAGAASPATITVSTDGITILPAGHIATIKSYLERRATPHRRFEAPPGCALERLGAADADRYRSIFTALGTEWLWWSRLLLGRDELAALLADPRIAAHAVVRNGADIGLLEWDRRVPQAPDLAFLGLVTGNTGEGLGNWLMSATLEALLVAPAEKVTVNTCTFDHPAALSFYRRWGFAVTAQAIEIVPDPRLSGVLPRSAGCHVPVSDPD